MWVAAILAHALQLGHSGQPVLQGFALAIAMISPLLYRDATQYPVNWPLAIALRLGAIRGYLGYV